MAQIAYNGRSDFVVGVDLAFETFESKALDQTLKFGSAGVSLRYYF